MTDNNLSMIPMMQPRRVITRTFTNQTTEYTIRITRPITEIDDFEEEIMALEEAMPDDVVMIQLSSPGGSLETCDFLCRRIQECKAPVLVEIGLTCASAASAICLQADDWKIHDSSTMMVHACSYSPGWGKEVDVFSSATYTNRVNREWVERTYKGFLTEQELQAVLDGKDLYFYADDLRERLPKYMEYRMELAANGCTCGECGLDNEAEDEPQFDLKDLIKQAVHEALAEREAVNATDKPAESEDEQVKSIVAPTLLERLVDNYPAYEAGKIYKVLESEVQEDGGYLLTIENDLKSQYTTCTTDYDFKEKWKIFK